MSTIDNIQKEDYLNRFLETLKNSVKPALGCTEPVAVGLATAVALNSLVEDNMADHMFREECYYLTQLSLKTNVSKPPCDPTTPRLEV